MKILPAWLTLAVLAPLAAADAAKMNAVEEVFRRSWNGYRQYAWGHDTLRPVSNSYLDDRYAPVSFSYVCGIDMSN
jgi:hypothetical protein